MIVKPSFDKCHAPASERNIAAFNADAAALGGYVYTAAGQWSSRYATSRQSDALIGMLSDNVDPAVRVVDIGCGDGTFTFDVAQRFRPEAIRGIDPTSNAIAAASVHIPAHLIDSVSFEVGDIYSLQSSGEDLAIARGVLHHLDRPQEAIAQLARQFTYVLILEPNGYNPAMKLIERLSSYHRRHDEKSYWPPRLNQWFRQEGFSVVSQKFFCLVPYFCPAPAARLLSAIEPGIERLPGVKHISCGTNLVLYKRI